MLEANKNKKKSNLIVQKYGGATLATPEKIKQVALRIHNLHQTGTQVVVVVSAMGQTTNQLITLARQVSPNPHLRELDMLLTVGERISMSLLSMALNDLGSRAISFTGSQAGILTDDSHVNATIIDVKAFRVEEALKENKIVILAGFQGVSPQTKEITTLGRGGSDTSAVAMAAFLKADRCEILKDVDAVYSADPKIFPNAEAIPHLHYDHLLEMTKWGAKVLHYKSVEMAKQKKVLLYVGSAADEKAIGTLVSDTPSNITKNLLSVNSFSSVFEIKTKNTDKKESQKNFLNLINKYQISAVEILFTAESTFFMTGPKENLELIEKIDFTNSEFNLIENALSTVSITYKEAPTDQQLKLIEQKLIAAGILINRIFISNTNINLVVSQKQQNDTIRLLHLLST